MAVNLEPIIREDMNVEPWSLKVGTSFKERARDLGAGALIAASFIGSGDVATGALAGGYYGFGYWWVYWFSGAVAWVAMDISARYWFSHKKTGLDMFRDVHWIFGLFLAIFGVYFGIGNVYSQIAVTGQGLQTFLPLRWEICCFIMGVICCLLVWIGKYNVLEKLFTVLLLMIVFSFFGAVFATGVSLTDAARGLIPSVDPKGMFSSTAQAIAGTNINGAAVLLFSYTLLEKKMWSDDLAERAKMLTKARADAFIGSFSAAIIAFAILGVINQVVYPYNIIPRKVEEFASLIEPVAGSWAIYIFSLGLWAAAFSTAIGFGMTGAYLICDYFGVESNNEALHFRVVFVINTLLATILCISRVDPMFLKNVTSGMNAMFFGLIGIVLFWWGASRKRMGYFANGKNIFLWILSVMMFIVALFCGGPGILGIFGVKF